ncbi:MAG: HAD-IIB family hydrolase [Promethearchaeota archaeon]
MSPTIDNNKKRKKLVISDLDGTLLDFPYKLSENYKSRLNIILSKGLDFTICTGRDFENTIKAISGLNFRNPIILTNGAIMAEYPSGKILDYLAMDRDLADKILEFALQNGISLMVFAFYDIKTEKIIFIKGDFEDKINFRLLDLNDWVKFRNNKNIEIISIQFCNDKDIVMPIFEKFKQYDKTACYILFFEDAFLEGKYWLEFNPVNAKKEVMLERLVKLKGYSLKDTVIFGDQLNDIGMLKEAGLACVVDNAPPEVKKFADKIVPSNKEGGVIKFLEENLEDLI